MTHAAHEVIKLNTDNPKWSSREIAVHLDASSGWVRTTLARYKRTVPSFFERRKVVGPMKARP